MTIDELLNIEGNRTTLEELVGILARNAVVPFVGAGMSVETGHPTWAGFLTAQVAGSKRAAEVGQLIDQGHFEEATDRVIDVLGRDGLNVKIDSSFSGNNKPRGAVTLLPKLVAGPVITTNFDRVLEDMWAGDDRFEHVYTGLVAGKITGKFRENRSARILIKLHGDIKDNTDRILSPHDYDKQYGADGQIHPDKPLTQVIDYVATTFSLLFLGCSLASDRTMLVLRQVQQRRSQIPHFAIVERPAAAADMHEKHKLLTSHGIRPIWYPEGDHGAVRSILEYLVHRQGPKGVRERILVAAIYSVMLVLLALAPLGFAVGSGEDKAELVAGILLQKSEWKQAEAEEVFRRMFEAFNALDPPTAHDPQNQPSLLKKRSPLRFATTVKCFTKPEKAIEALRSKSIDVLGELSLPDLRTIYRGTGAVPFVSPGYDRSGVYNSVFVISRKWLDEKVPGIANRADLSDDSIKPDLWRLAIEAHRDENDQNRLIALMDPGSASGYWYPAWLIVSDLRDEKLSNVAVRRDLKPDELLDAVESGEFIAGAVAEFRLDQWRAKRAASLGRGYTPGDLVVVAHRMPMIPNGAFVVRRALASNPDLLRTLQECWEIAGRSAIQKLTAASDSAAGAESPINVKNYLPPMWNAVDLKHYESALELLDTDPMDAHSETLRAQFLVAGGGVLSVVAILVLILLRRPREQ